MQIHKDPTTGVRTIQLEIRPDQSCIVMDLDQLCRVSSAVGEFPEGCPDCEDASCPECLWAKDYHKRLKERVRKVRQAMRQFPKSTPTS